MLVVNSTRLRPGHSAGPALNGTSCGYCAACPSSQISGANRSAKGSRSASRWKAGTRMSRAAPGAMVKASAPARHCVGSVMSRRMVEVVGHSRTDSSTQARR
ncbi:Uncharacterised protein [Mycobacteroides abscessus subsp. abscessus]|nr:Uncharacterised protein [Mycobacteroides abscessus subsp. abscessus]